MTAAMADEYDRGQDELLIADLQLADNPPHTPDGELTAEGQEQFHTLAGKLPDALLVQVLAPDVQERVLIRIGCSHRDGDLAAGVANRAAWNFTRRNRFEKDRRLLDAKLRLQAEVTGRSTTLDILERAATTDQR